MRLMREEKRYSEGLHDLFKRIGSQDIAIEVGTFRGESALIMAGYCKTVFTFDPYNDAFVKMYDKEWTPEMMMADCQKRWKDRKNIHFRRMTSILASTTFPSQSVDFVYIDGWHEWMPFLGDLLSWLPKVKPGGYIGGHDYCTIDNSKVIPVVDSLFLKPDRVFQDDSWIVKLPLESPMRIAQV